MAIIYWKVLSTGFIGNGSYLDSEIAKASINYVDQTISNLENNNPYEAIDNSYAGLNSISRLDFSKLICKYFNFDKSLLI